MTIVKTALAAMMAISALLVMFACLASARALLSLALLRINATWLVPATLLLACALTQLLLMTLHAMITMHAPPWIDAILVLASVKCPWSAPLRINATSLALVTMPLVPAPTLSSPMTLAAVMTTHALLVMCASLALAFPALLPHALPLINVTMQVSAIQPLACAPTRTSPTNLSALMVSLALWVTNA